MLTSCGGSPSQPSGIVGIVLIDAGGLRASRPPLPAGFGPGSQGGPYHFCTVQVTATSGPKDGQVVATAKSDSRALFRVDLPPGSYLLQALLPPGNTLYPQPTAVTVSVGQRARAIVIVRGF
jgi:hypothetical protein